MMETKKWVLCIRCTFPIWLPHLRQQSFHSLPGGAQRYEGGVVRLGGDATLYYCPVCAEGLRQCRVCGCTDEVACIGGCYWAEPDLCSRCAGIEEEPPPQQRIVGANRAREGGAE